MKVYENAVFFGYFFVQKNLDNYFGSTDDVPWARLQAGGGGGGGEADKESGLHKTRWAQS